MAKDDLQHYDHDAAGCWTDLVVSILSVNNRSVERTYELVAGLEKNGLVSPSNLAELDAAEICRRLKSAGYDRGEFMTNLFAIRLVGLGAFISKQGMDAATQVILSRDRRTIEKTLAGVYGIGPAVIRNFCALRGI